MQRIWIDECPFSNGDRVSVRPRSRYSHCRLARHQRSCQVISLPLPLLPLTLSPSPPLSSSSPSLSLSLRSLTHVFRHGALVKNAESLERIGTTNMVVFDKTGLFIFYFLSSFPLFFILTHFSGTLTSGTISVVEVFDFSGRREKREEGEESVLALAGSVEFKSPHPIAKAIVEHCKQNSILLLLFFSSFSIPFSLPSTSLSIVDSFDRR